MKVYKTVIPIDDKPHPVVTNGSILHVGRQETTSVCFWHEHWTDTELAPESAAEGWYQVFGTGHDIPQDAYHIGTVQDIVRGLVWHLYQVPDPVS